MHDTYLLIYLLNVAAALTAHNIDNLQTNTIKPSKN